MILIPRRVHRVTTKIEKCRGCKVIGVKGLETRPETLDMCEIASLSQFYKPREPQCHAATRHTAARGVYNSTEPLS
jgi:hypothetical protein